MKKVSKRTSLVEIFLLAAFVLIFRMVFEGAIPFFQNHFNLNFNETLGQLLRNYPLALLMVVLDFLLVWLLMRHFEYGTSPMARTAVEISGLALIAFISAFLLRATQIAQGDDVNAFFTYTFWYIALASLVFNAVIIAGIDIYVYYGRAQKKALDREIGQKNKARYQYQQLKRQMNPHFLFNSLNSLDYLIHTDPGKASEYVRKLASLYRYFLNIEDEKLVFLSDEVAFVRLYVDLLGQRFATGLQVTFRIEEEDLKKKIVPCGLQLLVENATKHNVISKDRPLYIDISSDGEWLAVRNNLQTKSYSVESTGLGLKNIRGQYLSASDKEIKINQGQDYFEVCLPLIE
jgi:hypothetical protein